jgi:hypothetical protein
MAKTGNPEDSTPATAGHRQQISQGRQPEPEARPEKRKKTGIISGKSLSIYQEGKDRQQAPGTAYD